VKSRGVNEFSSMVAGIVQAAQAAAGNSDGVDVTDLITKWSPLIAVARDSSVADALDEQATFYWEASTLLDPAKAVAELQGEENMSAILDAQIRTMREVSNRLRRRAAEWRGLSAEDQAIHDMAAGVKPAAAGPLVVPPLATHEVLGDITAAYYQLHPELDPSRTSLEYRNGDDGWYVAGHILIEHPPGLPVAPAPDCDCACCMVGDRKCYCNNSGKPKPKWCKCVPCKTARDEGRTAQEG
jgi:hypothetical protein